MLAMIIIWFYIFFLSYLYGRVFLDGLVGWLNLRPREQEFSLVILAGLISITTIGSFLSLMTKIGLLANLILLVGAFVILFRKKSPLKLRLPDWSVFSWFVLGLTILVVLENATHAPTNPDTAIYHAQTIRWIETYRVVPGLGNLNPRLAFNSSWLLLNALFSFAFLGGRSFHLAGSAFFLAFSVYSIAGLDKLLKRDFRLGNWVRVALLPLGLYTMGSELSSPGTDFPVILIVWMMVALCLEMLEDDDFQIDERIVLLFVAPLFAFTVKISALPLMLFSAGVLVTGWRVRRFGWALRLVGLGLLLLSPWLVRNVVLSGYLIFPVPQPLLFGFDWRVPYSVVMEQSQAIRDFARGVNAQRPGGVFAWVPGWWVIQTVNQRIIFALALLTPLTLPGLWFIRKKLNLLNRKLGSYLAVWFVAYLGLLFWFWTAPAFRFGYGFILGALLLAFLPYVAAFGKWVGLGRVWVPAMIACLVAVFVGFVLFNSFDPNTLSGRLVLPADYLPSRVQTCQLDGETIFCSNEFRQCGYQAFPCVPTVKRGIAMRGETFQQGFRSLSH
jgi:hypothetical protein